MVFEDHFAADLIGKVDIGGDPADVAQKYLNAFATLMAGRTQKRRAAHRDFFEQ